MEENFSVKRHDATTIKNNMDDLQSDVVELVVGSSPSNLSNKSSPETDFIPEPHTETLLLSKCGWKRPWVERDNYVSWDKIVFWNDILTPPENNLD